MLGISPEFYLALSNRELIQAEGQGVLRFYWNTTPQGAVRLMESTTAMLNNADLPFKLKVLNNPERFTRRDAAVLYAHKNDYETVAEILAKLHPGFAAHLKQGVPAFTKSLAKGLGLAEDPGKGESFGLHRCAILAEGIIRAHEMHVKAAADRLDVVMECFTQAGISPERPYLNPDAEDHYAFAHAPVRERGRARKAALHEPPATQAFLRTAHEIGERLRQQAIWSQGRCTWLSAQSRVHSAIRLLTRSVFKTLGPDI